MGGWGVSYSSTWRWVVSFMPRRFTPMERNPSPKNQTYWLQGTWLFNHKIYNTFFGKNTILMSSKIFFRGMRTCDISCKAFDPTNTLHRGYYSYVIFWFIQIWHFYEAVCESTCRHVCLKARPANKQNKHTWAHVYLAQSYCDVINL
jgi:hypothetical protein